MNAPEAARWLAYARSDLDAARALWCDPICYPRQVCFLAQQAAEKAIKTAFVLLEIEFPFTHDLDRLRNLLPAGWRVKTEYPDLADLTIWAIEARYPGDMPDVTAADARQALQTAEAVCQVIEQDMSRTVAASHHQDTKA
jgi:HEPN domain-containing protein